MNQLDADHIVAHLASLAAILGALMGYFPDLAAGAALVWYVLQLWEGKTVQDWRRKRRKRRR